MVIAITNATLTTLFAAIAAVAAFGSIVQAGVNHRRDVRDRAAERAEHREQFDRQIRPAARSSDQAARRTHGLYNA